MRRSLTTSAGGGRSRWWTLRDRATFCARRRTYALDDSRLSRGPGSRFAIQRAGDLHPRWSTLLVREDGTWSCVQMPAPLRPRLTDRRDLNWAHSHTAHAIPTATDPGAAAATYTGVDGAPCFTTPESAAPVGTGAPRSTASAKCSELVRERGGAAHARAVGPRRQSVRASSMQASCGRLRRKTCTSPRAQLHTQVGDGHSHVPSGTALHGSALGAVGEATEWPAFSHGRRPGSTTFGRRARHGGFCRGDRAQLVDGVAADVHGRAARKAEV